MNRPTSGGTSISEVVRRAVEAYCVVGRTKDETRRHQRAFREWLGRVYQLILCDDTDAQLRMERELGIGQVEALEDLLENTGWRTDVMLLHLSGRGKPEQAVYRLRAFRAAMLARGGDASTAHDVDIDVVLMQGSKFVMTIPLVGKSYGAPICITSHGKKSEWFAFSHADGKCVIYRRTRPPSVVSGVAAGDHLELSSAPESAAGRSARSNTKRE